MKQIALCVIAVLVLVSAVLADPDPAPQQITSMSWHGLSGLYVIPTARILGARRLAFGLNESKHTEFIADQKFTDRQVRVPVTYGVTDCLEVYWTYINEIYTTPPGREPELFNTDLSTFGLKLRVLKERPDCWYPDVAIAVRDIADQTADIGSLRNVNNGAKVYLLASKRVSENRPTGRFMDLHAGVTFDKNQAAGLLGFELALSYNMSLIAEGMWDSPYLNFRKFGESDQPGRFIFDVGARIYPEIAPGLVMDVGFVGDSEFEFSFGVSYVARL